MQVFLTFADSCGRSQIGHDAWDFPVPLRGALSKDPIVQVYVYVRVNHILNIYFPPLVWFG